MSHQSQRLDDLLATHPPLLDGGSWCATNDTPSHSPAHPDSDPDTVITQGDLIIKDANANEYTHDSDFSDTTVRLVLRADEHGIVYWDAHANEYGYTPSDFLREDLDGVGTLDDTPNVAHLKHTFE